MINNEYKRMQKLAGILKENVGTSQQWSDSIYDFITTNLSNDEKELSLVIKALEETIKKFKDEMGEYDPNFHYED
jgi:hypothetical protein